MTSSRYSLLSQISICAFVGGCKPQTFIINHDNWTFELCNSPGEEVTFGGFEYERI